MESDFRQPIRVAGCVRRSGAKVAYERTVTQHPIVKPKILDPVAQYPKIIFTVCENYWKTETRLPLIYGFAKDSGKNLLK